MSRADELPGLRAVVRRQLQFRVIHLMHPSHEDLSGIFVDRKSSFALRVWLEIILN